MIDRQQFIAIKSKAWPLIDSREQKECLVLAQYLQSNIDGLETLDAELYFAAQKLIIQLEWAALSIIKDDQEIFDLFNKSLLEGLELKNITGDDLIDLVALKLSWQFGFKLQETLQNIMRAIRENVQRLGKETVLVKNETRPASPVIRNWLIDFLRNTQTENPTNIDITNYLFKNPNAKKLPPNDRDILGRVIDLYNNLRAAAEEEARYERDRLIMPEPEEKKEPAPEPELEKIQRYYQPSRQENFPPQSTQPPAGPPNALPVQPTQQPSYNDRYREAVEQKDLAGPQGASRVSPPRPGPRMDGNVVNLREMKK